MRLTWRLRIAFSALALCAAAFFPEPARAQNVLLPEQSEAKAKELVQTVIAALGGSAYLKVRDTTCTGRLAEFASQGDLGGFVKIWDFTLLPDKNRTEYSKKRNIINIFNADKAWTLDRGGVEELPADTIQRFQEGLLKSMDHLLRFRLNEEGLIFRYGGVDILDLKQVEWIEVVDRDRRTTRIAVDKMTSLPMRAIYLTRDPETRQRIEEVEFFSNYHSVAGVMTPMQLARERNTRRIYQVFWDSCQYNTNLAESFFTRESLDQTWAKLNKGKKEKKD